MNANEWNKVEVEAGTWQPDLAALDRQVRMESCPDLADEFHALVAEAALVAHPRAVWKTAPVRYAEGEEVSCGGVDFRSAMLARNLSATAEAFPYLATCGNEIDRRFPDPGDPLAEYWLDQIKTAALYAVYDLLREKIRSTGGKGQLNAMNPGSGNARLWPLTQQVPLFRLIGDEASSWAGVALGDTLLMKPNKSVSGVFFFGADDYVSCTYCERAVCPNRRAAYGGAGM